MPTISVVVPAYNAGRFISRAVESLLDTGYPDLEILIVEDGSSDETLTIAEALAAQHHPVVKVLQHGGGLNKGVSASRNLGTRAASGELICFLDADDYVRPNRFDIAPGLLRESNAIDGVYELTVVEVTDGANEGRFWSESGSFGIAQSLSSEELLEALMQGSCIHVNSLTLRREILHRLGGFPDGFSYSEDVHLSLRLACAANVVAGNMETPVSVYTRHGSNTFSPSLDRKLDMLRVMADVYQWARQNRLSAAVLERLRAGLRSYLVGAMVVARETGHAKQALKMVRETLGGGAWFALRDTRALKQSAWALRESLTG